jgi:hemerythrin-like domain-containing protein
MDFTSRTSRRSFLTSTLVTGFSSTTMPLVLFAKEKKEEVGPTEDLMREHGALNRILLIYEEGLRRLHAKSDFDLEILKKSASIVENFIENYHEKLEEDYIFPRMRKAGKLLDLVETLGIQHTAGRTVTRNIQKLAVPGTLHDGGDRSKLIKSLEDFIIMYRPHESREDTILFPEFHKMLSKKEFEKIGDEFEDREHKLFGKEGFEGIVAQIEDLEKAYGIYDLSKFTPKS